MGGLGRRRAQAENGSRGVYGAGAPRAVGRGGLQRGRGIEGWGFTGGVSGVKMAGRSGEVGEG